MTRTVRNFLYLLMFTGGIALAPAQEGPLPAGPPAGATQVDRISSAVDTLAKSGDHARLVEALDAAGLSSALASPGPLTVFAPTDSAFTSSTYMSFDQLLREENRGKLAELLRYHIVSGSFDTATLDARIEAGGGRAVLTTMQGGELIVQRSAGEYTVSDEANHTARITATNLYQRNGVVQVVDQVLMRTNAP